MRLFISAVRLLLLIFLCSSASRGATTIGSDALVTMPNSALSNHWVNFRPPNGDTVTMNPPIFSWLFVPTPGDREADRKVWTYRLQVGYDTNFSVMPVNVTTPANFYNTLPIFTNNTVYWKVAYIDPSNGTTNSWTPIQTFTIATNAFQWDRSMLADTNYLYGKGHPHMGFDSNRLADVKSQLSTVLGWSASQQSTNDLYSVYNTTKNAADRVLNNDWTWGTGNFTIDARIKFNSLPVGQTTLYSSDSGTTNDFWFVALDSSQKLTMQFVQGGSMQGSYTMTLPWLPATNTWYSLAVERNGATGLIFIDGVSQTLTENVAFSTHNISAVYAPFVVGHRSGDNDFAGLIDNLRIRKSAVFTSNYTPSQPSGSTTDGFYFTFDGANNATNHVDSSSSTKLLGFFGNAHLTTIDKVYGSASAIMDGSGDYLTIYHYWRAPFSIPFNAATSSWTPATYLMPTLKQLALTHLLTGDTNYLIGTNVCFAAGQLARDAIDAGYANEVWDDLLGGVFDVLGEVYDWEFANLTQTAKDNIVKACELHLDFSMNTPEGLTSSQGWWRNLGTMTGFHDTLSFTNMTVDYSGAGKAGLGHPWANMNYALIGFLGVYQESTNQNCLDAFNLGMNYMLAKDYPFAPANGSGINTGLSYAYNAMQRNTVKTMWFNSAFPEAGFTNNPIYTNLVTWFDWMLPVGFQQANWAWGDVGYGRDTSWAQADGLGVNITALSGDGTAYTHWRNALSWYGGNISPQADTTLIRYANRMTNYLGKTADTNLARWFQNGGWVVGASAAPSTAAAFTNGVGFSFQARPEGTAFEHDHVSDGSFQLWAYGSVITDAGGSVMYPYPKLPVAHYSLLVDGYQQAMPLIQSNQFYCKMIAYETTSDHTYAMADLTECYPIKKFSIPGGWLYPTIYLTNYSSANMPKVPDLTKVRRHFLYMRRGHPYFVIFDELEAGANHKYSWLYHILENTLTINTNTATFSYKSNTQKYTGLNASWPDVTVYVSHITDPSKLSVVDMSGTDVRKNLISGENYYSIGDPALVRAHCVWVNNATTTTNFHFMTVVYPVKSGDSAPTITRIDDYTAHVVNGAEDDIISFNSATAAANGATLIVDLAAHANSAPTITGIADQSIPQDTSTSALSFTLADDIDDPATLTPSKATSNSGLVPTSGIALAGSGADRTVTVTPSAGQTGSAIVTLTVTDSGGLQGTASFRVDVTAGPPIIPARVGKVSRRARR